MILVTDMLYPVICVPGRVNSGDIEELNAYLGLIAQLLH